MIGEKAFGGAIWDVLVVVETMYGSTVRFAALLAFAATGEWVAEKAGTINISVEAMVLTGAFTSALGSHWVHDPASWLALLLGVAGRARHRRGSNRR